jgi:HEAT repeat protein
MDRRVFVSSTYTDLIDFRESVMTTIRQLDAIDVAMEHFGARDEHPKDECLRLIKEDSDIFIGIYAHRYGFIPQGDNISLTEAEYNEATVVGLPRLIYIINDSTPWIPSLIDQGNSATLLKVLKDKLKANHICAFYSNKDDLAAKVAADLGRHFTRMDISVNRAYPATIDTEREERLIKQLRSTDRYDVKRSIHALAPSHNPWLIDALSQFVIGTDEQLADISISTLREIPGRRSAEVIVLGLSSTLWQVRSHAAYTIGEMALFGRQQDSATVIDTLIEASQNPAEYSRVLDEMVHSIGKIGGQKAFDSLVKILESDSFPSFLKAKALHAPGRFWRDLFYDKFVNRAIPIIQKWSVEQCKEIANCSIFEYIKNPLKDAVTKQIQGCDT